MSKHYNVPIMDHAIVRYLERVYKLDLLKIRNEILSEEEWEKYKDFGTEFLIKKENYTLVVSQGVIKTILSPEMVTSNLMDNKTKNKYRHKLRTKCQQSNPSRYKRTHDRDNTEIEQNS